jgi:formyltetrahydrofolate deformylase
MIRNNVIRIKCPDQKGLIAAISGVLFANGHNIVVMREFVDTSSNTFFARLEIEGEPKATLYTDLVNMLPKASEITLVPVKKKNIVVLVTREHHCLSDLLVRQHFDGLHANINAVIGNYDSLKLFTEKFNVPFHFIDHTNKSQEAFEKELMSAIMQYAPDYLVLAKFMRILSPAFVSAFKERIINIHHSFLPAFKGAKPYRQAFDRGVKLIGATAHIVNNELDDGPIISQQIIPVAHHNSLEDMIDAGQEVEKSVLADALQKLLEDRIFVSGNKTIVFD